MYLLFAIIGWTLFGFIIGGIARFLMPGRQALTFFQTTILGVVGSLAGGFIAYAIWGGEPLQPSGWILSLLGALIVLGLGTSFSGRSSRPI